MYVSTRRIARLDFKLFFFVKINFFLSLFNFENCLNFYSVYENSNKFKLKIMKIIQLFSFKEMETHQP